jgi:hypothetical protein
MTVPAVESEDLGRARMDTLRILEPLGVLQVELQRKRLDIRRRLPTCLEEALDGVASGRIQVPIASRTKHHPHRHVPLPKGHGPADHDVIDAELLSLGRHGQAERSSTDDQEPGMLVGSQYRQLVTSAPAGAVLSMCSAMTGM